MTLDAASITFTVTGKALNGASFSTTKTQTFAKSRAGVAAVGYTIDIESTNGTVFKNGTSRSTSLKAYVFSNGVDVTSSLPSTRFRWRRVSYVSDPTGDATWNGTHSTGFKQIDLVIDGTEDLATYYCDILE